MREDVADYQTFLITDTSDEASSSYENIVTRDHSSNSTNSDQVAEMLNYQLFCLSFAFRSSKDIMKF